MIFEKYLIPDEMVKNFECVTPEHLQALGKKYIFCDIDNTLVTYDDPEPPENVKAWCRRMNDGGITVAFVSNNHAERVERFNRELCYVALSDAHKPGTRVLRQAMDKLGADIGESVLLGDQLLTDAAAAKSAGLYCIIVPPIKDKKTLFFRFKRWFEVPYVKKYRNLHK